MEPSKLYIIDENTLKHLLARESELSYLESVGVDNWSYYGECRDEYIKEEMEILLGNPLSDNVEDLDFEDIAEERIKNFSRYYESSYEDDLK